MKVSVIVTVYNVENYLRKCLDSLVKQKFDENYEIIVVNDGSKDNSQDIINEYKKEYKDKIKSYEKKNGGVSEARNFGMEKAIGDYIAFIDGDDYVSDDYLKKMYEKIIEEKTDVVICDFYKAYDDHLEEKIALTKDELLFTNPSVWAKLFKRNLFFANNILFSSGSNYAEDLEVFLKLNVHVKNYTYVKEPLIYYVQRPDSITNEQKFNSNKLDIFKTFENVIKYYKEKMKYNKNKEKIEYLAIIHLMHALFIQVYKYEEATDVVNQINDFMKVNFSNWSKNKYFKDENWKFKLVCYLIKKRQIKILRLLLK